MIDFTKVKLEKVLRLDVEAFASNLEYTHSSLLVAPPKGIYVVNKLEPVMIDGQEYFVNQNNTRTPLVDINTWNDSVFDTEGDIVIPKRFMLDKTKYVSNSPFVPYIGLKIIQEIIRNIVYGSLKHMQVNNILDDNDEIRKNLIPNITDRQVEELLNDCFDFLSDLITDVRSFIDGNLWNIYHVRIDGKYIRIDRYEDFRVNEWNQWVEGKLESSSLSRKK